MSRIPKTFAAAAAFIAISAVPALAEETKITSDTTISDLYVTIEEGDIYVVETEGGSLITACELAFYVNGEISISNGAAWTSSCTTYIKSTGTANFTGSGTTWTTSATTYIYGSVDISGATWNSGSVYLGTSQDSSGTLTISDGATWTSSNIVYIYGSATISDSTLTNSKNFYVVGTTSITGSTWTSTGNVNVSTSSVNTGDLFVSNTTWTSSSNVYIGSGSNSEATLTVSDGSTWTSSGLVYIHGTATITGSTWTSSDEVYVGTSSTSTANLIVSDGATWKNKDYVKVYSSLTVTDSGTKWTSSDEVKIQSGGTVTIANGATWTLSDTLTNSGKIYLTGGGQITLKTSNALGAVEISLDSAYLVATADHSYTSAEELAAAVAAGTLELGTKTDEDGITAITTSSKSYTATGTVSLSAVATDEAIVKELAAQGYYEYALAYSSWSLKIDIDAFSESLAEALSSLNLWSVVSYEESTGILSIYVGAIPEPNLFGIFAGLSALALAGTRRRKRRSRA